MKIVGRSLQLEARRSRRLCRRCRAHRSAKRAPGRTSKDRGATLVELLVSLVFVALFATMLHQFSRSMLYGVRVLETASEAAEGVRIALHVMARDLRDAGFSIDGQLGNGVTIARADALEVVADRNGDGDTNDANERVGYSTDAVRRSLRRSMGNAPPQPLLSDLAVDGMTLEYFDSAGAPLATDGSPATQSRIRRVDVSLRLELPHPDPAAQAPVRVEQRGSVALRNGGA
jgi:type II secretory pathway component PulJ